MSQRLRVVVLGASGLIGGFIAADLMRRGLSVVAVARRFTAAQRAQFGDAARKIAIADLGAEDLARILGEADVVVNCLGVLQDSPSDSTRAIHTAFVTRLLAALRTSTHPALLVQISMPGADSDDRTAFARSKREAEHAVASSELPYAILRPGFVWAPAAYGGSAMLRALATLPVDIPQAFAQRPFAVVAVEDIAETVALLAQRWSNGEREFALRWDLMHPAQSDIGTALTSLRHWLGTASQWRATVPKALIKLGGFAGDCASWFGWRPPMRTTAVAELQRGVAGDPRAWMAATGIAPRKFDDLFRARPATVQEKWFARLYPMKALIVSALVIFWCASALIVLTVAYPSAVAVLTSRGFPVGQAQFMTIAGSILDFSVGVAIAFRPSHRFGLRAGIAVSLFYMVAAAIFTPDLWIEPLGALVKTLPAIVLMAAALAVADDR